MIKVHVRPLPSWPPGGCSPRTGLCGIQRSSPDGPRIQTCLQQREPVCTKAAGVCTGEGQPRLAWVLLGRLGSSLEPCAEGLDSNLDRKGKSQGLPRCRVCVDWAVVKELQTVAGSRKAVLPPRGWVCWVLPALGSLWWEAPAAITAKLLTSSVHPTVTCPSATSPAPQEECQWPVVSVGCPGPGSSAACCLLSGWLKSTTRASGESFLKGTSCIHSTNTRRGWPGEAAKSRRQALASGLALPVRRQRTVVWRR